MDQPSLEQQVRSRIDSPVYLPTTMAVATKFMALSKDPNAGPAEYAQIIGTDSALSSKLLGLANSSWYGVRNKVTRPSVAVSLLGLGTVRSFALSYCPTGLHSDLAPDPQHSRTLWAASLCKAAAARVHAARLDEERAEEAFTASLLQDIALPVMCSGAPEMVLGWLGDRSLDWRTRLRNERGLFGFDHTELGRLIAQRLNLPDVLIDAIASHHDADRLRKSLDHSPLADSLQLASLLPHGLDAWSSADAEQAVSLLDGGGHGNDGTSFLDAVQDEFNRLCAYFEPTSPPPADLKGLLSRARQGP